MHSRPHPRRYTLRKFQMAMFAAALLVVAGIAPSYAHGSTGTATSATSGVQVADAMADFGTPPSGEVPILFNDHHVYAKPDTLRQGRVLAAIPKNCCYVTGVSKAFRFVSTFLPGFTRTGAKLSFSARWSEPRCQGVAHGA